MICFYPFKFTHKKLESVSQNKRFTVKISDVKQLLSVESDRVWINHAKNQTKTKQTQTKKVIEHTVTCGARRSGNQAFWLKMLTQGGAGFMASVITSKLFTKASYITSKRWLKTLFEFPKRDTAHLTGVVAPFPHWHLVAGNPGNSSSLLLSWLKICQYFITCVL